jgi:parvulin-like peptidyl-prolyl isomerase
LAKKQKLVKKREKPEVKSHLTRRQLSKHRRQQRIQHIIYITGAVFLALVIGFVGYGYWDVQVRPFHEPVAKINGTTYDMGYYLKMLELYTRGQDSTKTASMANDLIKIMEYNQEVVKAAPELGVTVSDDEVKSVLQNASLPDEKVYRDAALATLFSQKLTTDYFDKQVPSSAEQARTEALFVESSDIADKLATRLNAGDNFTELATEFSLEPITKQYGGQLGWLPKGFTNLLLGNLGNSKLADVPFTLQPGVLSQPIFDGVVKKPLGYWVVQVTEKDPTKGSHVRGILTGSQHDAQSIRTMIIDGEDFATLVKKYSQDTANSDNVGDMGWTGTGEITNRLIQGIALPLEVGAVSQPAADSSVETIGGFWLIKVLEKDDNRVLDDSTRQALTTVLFENWITDKMKNDSVQTIITEDKKTWAIDLVNKTKGQ